MPSPLPYIDIIYSISYNIPIVSFLKGKANRHMKWPSRDSVLRRINWPYVGRQTLKAVAMPFVVAGLLLKGLYAGAMLLGKGIGKMGILSSLFSTAVIATAAVGVCQLTQQNEIVRAKVTGRVQADADSKYPGLKYLVYTDNTLLRLDTFSTQAGRELQEGCIYDFNLKGMRLQVKPPGLSRSIVSATKISCGG